MEPLETTTQTPTFPWGQILSLYSAITYVMLGIDMALLHLGYRHYHFIAVLPIAFCGVAAVVSLLTTFSRWLRRQAWVLGVLAMVVGMVGTYIHLEIAFANLNGLAWNVVLERLVFDPRPPLAPAALAGTGLVLLLVAVAERWPIPWIFAICRRVPVIRGWVVTQTVVMPCDQVLK